MTNQEDRQAAFRAISSTTLDYNGDSLAAFIAEGATSSTYNGAFIEFLQGRLSTSHDSLPDLMQEFAELEGASSWDELGTFSAGVFKPTDISGNALWLDGADSDTIAETSDKVSQWDDKSTAGNDVLQGSGGSQPTTNTETINSLNVLTFNGSTEYLSNTAPFLYDAVGCTVFMVLKGGAQADRRPFAEGNSGSNNTFYAMIGTRESGAGDSRVFIRNDNNSVALSADGTAGQYDDTAFLQRYVDSGTNIKTFVDGVADINANYTRGTLTTNTFSVGAMLRGSAISHFSGEIAEVIAYTRVITGSEVTQVEDYLNEKWGL